MYVWAKNKIDSNFALLASYYLFIFSILWNTIRKSVEVYRGTNLHSLSPSPQTVIDTITERIHPISRCCTLQESISPRNQSHPFPEFPHHRTNSAYSTTIDFLQILESGRISSNSHQFRLTPESDRLARNSICFRLIPEFRLILTLSLHYVVKDKYLK